VVFVNAGHDSGAYNGLKTGTKLALILAPAEIKQLGAAFKINGSLAYYIGDYPTIDQLRADGKDEALAGISVYAYVVDAGATVAEVIAGITAVLEPTADNEEIKRDGDVSDGLGGDSAGTIDYAYDYAIVRAIYVGDYDDRDTISLKSRLKADVNGDGYVDVTDLNWIYMHLTK
jgi:hypothetical protein